MASVNKKNAARNFENAFKNVGARPEGARTADDGVDPFSRRKTRPMNYWTTKRKQAAADGAHLLRYFFICTSIAIKNTVSGYATDACVPHAIFPLKCDLIGAAEAPR